MDGKLLEKIFLIVIVGYLAQIFAYPILNATVGKLFLPAASR
jgi:hypothetical protein